LTGNLGGDPEIHYSQDGSPIASFNLAFHTSAKKEEPNWIRYVSFGKLAETVEKYLHKGARIAIVGTLD
jgi:single-strand DNA-binding protein